MKKKITVLKGDGIGPEVIDQALQVLNAIEDRFDHHFELDFQLIGAAAIDETSSPLPDGTLHACLNSDAILLGAVGDPKYDNDPNATIRPEQGLLALRKELGLFCNVRPVKLYKSLSHLSPLKSERLNNVDFVVYRELTGGIYFGEKKSDGSNQFASDLCSYSRPEIERIAHLAFQEAQKRNKRMCLVDKANVLETSRLWRAVVKDIATDYPDVELDFMFVDNAAMQIIMNPGQFDVVLTENMFGDILTDEASVLSGSLGLLASSSKGNEHALFEPIHGSYPQAKGKDIANPIASVLSVAMMMDHFDMIEEAEVIRAAVDTCLNNKIFTKDLDEHNYIPCSKMGEIISEIILSEDCEVLNIDKMVANMSTII